jgi:hypothetical protein
MLGIVRRIIRRIGRGQRGQSLVEFAFVLPIFLLVLCAIVDFGMAFHGWITVTNSAREGGRLGAVHPALDVAGSPCYGYGSIDQCIEAKVREAAGSLGDDVTVEITNADGLPGESVVVKVSYDYTVMTPLAGMIGVVSHGTIGESFTLSSTADFRLE